MLAKVEPAQGHNECTFYFQPIRYLNNNYSKWQASALVELGMLNEALTYLNPMFMEDMFGSLFD